MGDLVYLIKKIDDAWLYGHCAGVEGMFPSNYVNVVVPLPDEDEIPQPQKLEVKSKSSINIEDNRIFFADALYKFDAETDGDISLRVRECAFIMNNHINVNDFVNNQTTC